MPRCSRASPDADLRRWREPRGLRLCSRCRWRRRLGAFVKGFGDSTGAPSESTAKDLRPGSTPTTGPSTGCGSSRSTSTARDTHRRSASRLTVAERMRPRNFSVVSLVSTQLTRGSVTEPGWTSMLPVSRKESRRPCLRKRERWSAALRATAASVTAQWVQQHMVSPNPVTPHAKCKQQSPNGVRCGFSRTRRRAGGGRSGTSTQVRSTPVTVRSAAATPAHRGAQSRRIRMLR